jgi:predicted Zn-dependent protease
MKPLLISVLFVFLVFLIDCASVPITGRSQLNLIDNAKVFPMSFSQYEQIKKEAAIITGTPESDMIQRVGKRIQKSVEQYFEQEGQSQYLSDYAWEFNLIKDDAVKNAWCMPGGKVAFYTGIIPTCQDESGVAVVMGHEVAHAIANHGRERISQQTASQVGLTALSIFLGGSANAAITNEMIMQGAGAATSVGILKFSRKHESEADKLGLYFMAMAGYDPTAAPTFWARRSSGDGQEPPEFISTPPSHKSLIKDLNKNMPKALAYYKAANKN